MSRSVIGKLVSRRMIGILLTIGLTAGCSNKDRVPSGVLSREKMENVLWDMIQADQYSSFLAKDSAHIDVKLERLRLYEQVFLLHGVTREEFRKSYDFYLAHPDMTQTIFDSLQSKANRLRGEAYSRPSVNPVAPAPVVKPVVPPVWKPVATPPRGKDSVHRGSAHRRLIP